MATTQSPGVWGIDIGQCALKALRLEQQKDGTVTATAFEYVEHPKILSQPDADPDQLTREALEQFLSRNNIRGDMVVISVPGQSGLARFVKLPPVQENKIADIVKFEAKQQIPFPLDEVVWDFQKIGSGMVMEGLALETEIGLFAMKRDMVNRALNQFKDVNVEVHCIQMAPLALCNFVAYDLLGKGNGPAAEGEEAGGKSCVVALDIGTDNSNLVITDGGKVIWQRPIPLGGNHFTRVLTKDMKLTFAKAEHLKRNAAKSPDLKKILASLKSVLNDFVGEVQRSLGYFTNTHRDASIEYMVGLGNGFKLPGLQKYLQEKLQLEVRKMASLEKVGSEAINTSPNFNENVGSFAVAYGLALQGLKQARIHTNLLPHEVRVERIVRGKKPWAVAAASILMIAVAGMAYSESVRKNAIGGEDIAKSMKGAEAVHGQVSKANSTKTEFDTKITESGTTIEKLSAGVPQRKNWRQLHQYINLTLPVPNGARLTRMSSAGEDVFKTLMTKEALQAYQLLEAKRFSDGKDTKAAKDAVARDEFIKKHLVQINLEGINALFTEDIPGFLINASRDAKALPGMDQGERDIVAEIIAKSKEGNADAVKEMKVPKQGWVVEIRGYTYHDLQIDFVKRTILENLKVYPGGRKPDRTPITPISDELKKNVKDQISFLYIPVNEVVKDPQPGRFLMIGSSKLRSLVRAPEAAGGGFGQPPGGVPPGAEKGGGAPPMPMGPAGDLAAAGVAGKASRDSWSPLGDIAAQVLGGGGGGFGGGFGGGAPPGFAPPQPEMGRFGGPPPGPMGPMGPGFPPIPGNNQNQPTSATPTQPRTEFIIIFVWAEPLPVPVEEAPKS